MVIPARDRVAFACFGETDAPSPSGCHPFFRIVMDFLILFAIGFVGGFITCQVAVRKGWIKAK